MVNFGKGAAIGLLYTGWLGLSANLYFKFHVHYGFK